MQFTRFVLDHSSKRSLWLAALSDLALLVVAVVFLAFAIRHAMLGNVGGALLDLLVVAVNLVVVFALAPSLPHVVAELRTRR